MYQSDNSRVFLSAFNKYYVKLRQQFITMEIYMLMMFSILNTESITDISSEAALIFNTNIQNTISTDPIKWTIIYSHPLHFQSFACKFEKETTITR